MDTTTLTVIGTGLSLFVALWRVQGNRFDALERHMDKRFEAADERWTERFEMAEKLNRERFEMAEKLNRERFEGMDAKWTERFEGMDRRFETVERQGQATHAAVCTLNGRLDDLYRHLLGTATPPAQGGPAAG